MQAADIRADIKVRDSEGSGLALVEVKNRTGLTPDIAVTLRRNLLAHGLANQNARFFLLVSQDIGYLWDQNTPQDIDHSSPTVEFPMDSVIQHYLPSLSGSDRLSESQVELAVTQWLWDLANGVNDRPLEPEIALSNTDFLRLIRGGRLDTEVEA